MNCQKLENLVNFLAQMSFPVEKVFFKILTFKEGLVQSRNTKYFCEDLRRKLITCSWHQKNETTNSPIHEFKVLQNVF